MEAAIRAAGVWFGWCFEGKEAAEVVAWNKVCRRTSAFSRI